jgi:SAM domain (Sterile alpha motif)
MWETCHPRHLGINSVLSSCHDRTLVAAMQQIADWLKKLGLSYTERFVENGIEIDVLSELTDQDLEKLGVLLGHRRRMLRAIRDLGSVSIAPAAPSVPVATEPTRRDDPSAATYRHVHRPRRL